MGTAQPENTTDAPSGNSPKQQKQRKKLPGIRLERDFFGNYKTDELLASHGPIALLILQRLWLAIGTVEGARLHRRYVGGLGAMFGFTSEATLRVAQACVDLELVQVDGEFFTDRSVEAQAKAYQAQVDGGFKVKAKQAGGSLEVASELPQGNSSNSNSNSIPPDPVLPSSEGSPREPFTLPPAFDTPEMRKALAAWGGKLKAQRRSLDQIQLDALCARFREPKALLDALIYSCSLSRTNNVHAPPEPRAHGKTPRKGAVSERGYSETFEHNARLIAKYEAEERAEDEARNAKI